MEMPINYILITKIVIYALTVFLAIYFIIYSDSTVQKIISTICLFLLMFFIGHIHLIEGNPFPVYNDVIENPILYKKYIKRYHNVLGKEKLSQIELQLYKINSPESIEFADYIHNKILH